MIELKMRGEWLSRLEFVATFNAVGALLSRLEIMAKLNRWIQLRLGDTIQNTGGVVRNNSSKRSKRGMGFCQMTKEDYPFNVDDSKELIEHFTIYKEDFNVVQPPTSPQKSCTSVPVNLGLGGAAFEVVMHMDCRATHNSINLSWLTRHGLAKQARNLN